MSSISLRNLCTSQFKPPPLHGLGIGIGIGIDPLHGHFSSFQLPDSDADSDPDQAVERPVQRFPNDLIRRDIDLIKSVG
jgi:hypothetical protein